MKYTAEEKNELFNEVAELMKIANIELRDTWDGYTGENYDDLEKNEGRSDGPKSIEIIQVEDGNARLETKRYQLDVFNSLSYEDSKILIPKRLANKVHPIVHEVVHFLQHNTIELDDSYKCLKSETKEDFKKFVDQPSEQEAHFVQLLYINKYELNIQDEKLTSEFKQRLDDALKDKTKRTDLIVYAKENQIL